MEKEQNINNEIKPLTPELVLIGTIAQKLGKNGLLELDISDNIVIHSVNINVENGKVTIYAE